MFNVCIPSLGRPNDIKTVDCLPRDFPVNLFVYSHEEQLYRNRFEGYQNVIWHVVDESNRAGKYPWIINYILSSFGVGDKVLILDDDISNFRRYTPPEGRKPTSLDNPKLTPDGVVSWAGEAFQDLEESGYKLFGVLSPQYSASYLYYRVEAIGMRSNKHFCIGSCLGIIVSDLRMDTNVFDKNDYIFTVENFVKYGGVRRHNYITLTKKEKQKGGTVSYRTTELKMETCKYMVEKFPNYFILNSKRPGEIILRYREKVTVPETIQGQIAMF